MNVPAKIPNHGLSMLMDPTSFEHMNRVGKVLATSPLFPDHLRKGSAETAIANGILVMNMAIRLNEDPLTVAQNIHFIGGKPGWSATYMIAKANQHGVFKNRISWDTEGEGEELSVTAHVILDGTGQRVTATCDMAMAQAEGWTRNPKYKSMPKLMLSYRSATMLIRLYCPEVMVGIPSVAEIDMPMRDITPYDMGRPTHSTWRDPNAAVDEPAHDADGMVLDDAPEPETKAETKPKAETKEEPKAKETPPKEDVKTDAPKNAPADDNSGETSGDGPTATEAMMRLAEMVRTDLGDGGRVSDIEEMYGAQIEAMAEQAPDLHAVLTAEIEAAREG